jgi:apolipoprotein N-acyltransferase
VLLSALLYGLSFPKFSVSIAGFIFLIPILYLLKKGIIKKAFLVFYIFSFLSYLVILYWIPNVMVRYGGMSPALGILGIIILAAFLSLFNGAAGSLLKRLPLYMAPVIWTVRDLVIEHIFGGFPWCQTGYSQHNNLYFIQLAEFGGIHLISFILIGINVLLYRLITKKDKYTAAAIAIILVFIYTTGFFLYRATESKVAPLDVHKAGIIQPNTNNDWISRAKKDQILDRLFRESAELSGQGAEFIIWPEHTVAIYPLQNRADFFRFMSFARFNVPLLAGFTDRKGYGEIYNSMILFEKDGAKKYDKVHLAPFGEYVLFREVLFFVKRITDEIADFTPGAEAGNLNINGHRVGTPICYEVIFPELVRQFSMDGGELIITGSNDSWFGDTSAPYQHLAMALFRSIENRRYILRSTTNGISGVIAPTGEIEYQAPRRQPAHFIAEFKYIKGITFYNCCGYLFPYVCLFFLLLYLAGHIYRNRKSLPAWRRYAFKIDFPGRSI